MQAIVGIIVKIVSGRKHRFVRISMGPPKSLRVEISDRNKQTLAIRLLNLSGASLSEKAPSKGRSSAYLDISDAVAQLIIWMVHLVKVTEREVRRLRTFAQIRDYLGARALLGD